MRETCVGPYLDGFETALTEAGYAHLTVRGYLRAAEHLAWWAGRRRVDIRAWDEDLVQRFRRHHLPHCKCFRDNKGTFGNESYGLKLLFKYLRATGVMAPAPKPTPKFAPILEKFAAWMLHHRGLTRTSARIYRRMLQPFVETPAGGLPRFVCEEFEAFLRCGILEHGCLSLVCRHCGHSELVAFSCKRRGFCPACLGRRMADTAVHLEERVLPQVPIRHWICSLPWGLRALLGYDRRLCSVVAAAFVEELCRSLRWRAKEALGLASVAEAVTGAVAAVQRTDSALRLNVHFHILALDGVYVRDAEHGALVFHALPPLTRADVADVAQATASRIEKLLRAQGRSLDRACADPTPPELKPLAPPPGPHRG